MEILEKCLKACDSTLSTAADLLSEVKERRVLNELFSSTEGIEKAQGMYIGTKITNNKYINFFTNCIFCRLNFLHENIYICLYVYRLF